MAAEQPEIARRRDAFAITFRRAAEAHWLRALFLVLVAFIIHSPALNGQFIWDDNYLAHDNPLIKSPLFLFEVFRHHLFLDSLSAHYRPVQTVSFMVDYFFWNDNTYGFHLTNITLHALSGVTLYFLLRRLFASLFQNKLAGPLSSAGAFLVSLGWLVHPVHSAAIDYISGRADSLAFFFASAGWLLYLRARETNRRNLKITLFASAIVLALLALCSRETAALWLIIFLLHTLFFSKPATRRAKVVVLAGCVFVLAIYGALHALPASRPQNGPKPGWAPSVRAVLMLRALGDYGRLMIFPANLHMERTVVDTRNYDSQHDWQQSVATEYLSIAGLLVGALLALGCFWKGRGRNARIFGVVWFMIGFLPISNLFDLNATVAEHWLYLPSVGLLIFAAAVALDLPARFHRPIALGAVAATIALSVRAGERSGDWTTPEHFYRQTIAAGGTSTRVSLNLGQLYAGRGEYARAEAIFREILAAYPNYPAAQTNLANALFHEGEKNEAEALFAAASRSAPQMREEYPRTWLATLNLAGMHEQQNDLAGALAIADKARADYPRIWEIVSFEAELLRKKNGPAAAIPIVEKYRCENWWSEPASLALGQLYAENGDATRAEKMLRWASRLDVHDVEALHRLVELRMQENRLADACSEQRRAVARQPDRPSEYLFLSRILTKMGRTAEASRAIAMIAQLEDSARDARALAAN
ncbi:MAG TPA: tetratricopeptide repeat protein [Chthoniobacterales bacterium]|jgi:tetratricopeptide (TPR) repeat protein